MSWHFLVPQHIVKIRQIEDDEGTFEVIDFSGENHRCGMSGHTYGTLVNQIIPEQRTVFFTRYYYSDGAGQSSLCDVSKVFKAKIKDFSQKHNISLYGDVDTMTDEADGCLFMIAEQSSDFIVLND